MIPLTVDEAAEFVTAMRDVGDGRRTARTLVLGKNRGRLTVMRSDGLFGFVYQPDANDEVIYLPD